MLWFFKPRVIVQKPTGERYYPKIVNASTLESYRYSDPAHAEIEVITNRSPYTSDYINPLEADDIVRLQVSCRMSPKEKYVYVDLFEGRIETISADYNTKNNTTLSCKGHINAATKHLIEETKTWTGTVEARAILSYFVKDTASPKPTRLTWSNAAPYVDQTGTINFTDSTSAYATKADQTYLSSIFEDMEKQAGYDWKIGTKAVYTSGGLLDKVYLTWKLLDTAPTDKYKAIQGTARYLSSTFNVSIEDQATQYKVKGDTPSGGTQYSGTYIDNTAAAAYGRKTDVDVFTQLQSNATCAGIAAGVGPSRIDAVISGTIKLIGTPEARPGDMVTVKAKSTELNGAEISGDFTVFRVRHNITQNSYTTEIQVGKVVVDAYDLIRNIKKTATVSKCNQVK